MRFYLDENLSPIIAGIARGLGVDIVTSRDAGMNGAGDDVQLRFAAEQGRCVVTEDGDDFQRETKAFMDAGWPHAGVLCLPRSMRPNDFRRVAEAIQHYGYERPDDAPPYFVDYLRSPSS